MRGPFEGKLAVSFRSLRLESEQFGDGGVIEHREKGNGSQ